MIMMIDDAGSYENQPWWIVIVIHMDPIIYPIDDINQYQSYHIPKFIVTTSDE